MISYREHPLHWKIYLDQSFGQFNFFHIWFNHLYMIIFAFEIYRSRLLYYMDSLPCLLFLICLRDTFIPEHTKLKDPRRLYAPGRMYHIVERKFCRWAFLKVRYLNWKLNLADKNSSTVKIKYPYDPNKVSIWSFTFYGLE